MIQLLLIMMMMMMMMMMMVVIDDDGGFCAFWTLWLEMRENREWGRGKREDDVDRTTERCARENGICGVFERVT